MAKCKIELEILDVGYIDDPENEDYKGEYNPYETLDDIGYAIDKLCTNLTVLSSKVTKLDD